MYQLFLVPVLCLFIFSNPAWSMDTFKMHERPEDMAPICQTPGALRPMDLEKVEYIVVRTTGGMPFDWGPEQIQEFHMQGGHDKQNPFCDIAYHFGILLDYNSSPIQPYTVELRGLGYKGAFLSGHNNNIGLMLHLPPDLLMGTQDRFVEIAKHITQNEDYPPFPNLKGFAVVQGTPRLQLLKNTVLRKAQDEVFDGGMIPTLEK